jgi:upstream activation factor subunit UAF30
VKSISDLVKAAIKALILERFDVFAEKAGVIEEPVQSVEIVPPTANGNHTHTRDVSVAESKTASPMKREAKSEGLSDMADSPPPKKKRKSMIAEDDAALAARLQAEENTRSRPTRGAPRRAAPAKKKKTPKKKSSTRIKDNSDDDGEGSDTSGEKPVRNTGFHKPLNLSPALSELLGETTLSRPQTTKKIWEYIKARDLQNPSDRRQILCDEKMRAVFKVDSIHMFTMTKVLNQQMYNPDE